MDIDFQEKEPILVLAADTQTCHSLTGMMTAWGLETATAADGNAALEMLARRQFALLILDITPAGMEGLELGRRARELADNCLPFICVTDSADDDTLQAIFAAGGQDFILKPLRPAEVEFRVKSALRLRQAMEQATARQKLAGAVCHELNQPLQYIMGMVQLALMDVEQKHPVCGQLKSIQEKIEQMGSITGRLMTIIRDYGAGGLPAHDRKAPDSI